MQYNESITINGVDYTEYLSATTRLNITRDGTLDSGAVELEFTDVNEPFKPYSKVVITYTAENTITRIYRFDIENDDCKEIQIGASSKYNHEISLVEETQDLSLYVLGGFSVTQPKSFVKNIINNNINGELNKGSYPNATQGSSSGVFVDVYTMDFNCIYPTLTISNNTISLPQIIGEERTYEQTKFGNIPVGSAFTIAKVNVNYIWYYKINTNTEWIEIGESGILTLEQNVVYNIKAVEQQFSIETPTTSITGTVTFPIVTYNTGTELVFEDMQGETTGFTSLADGIKRILHIAHLEYPSNAEITLDENIITIANLNNLECPEYIESAGKNLLEVMYTIGLEINGYPRLTNNILTFDLTEFTTAETDYKPTTELISQESDMSNYANNIVSDVSNMVITDNYSVFPATNQWFTVRCLPTESALTKENMCLLLPYNILYIQHLFVKNWNPSDYTQVVDIASYVYENVAYQALNPAITGQGTALRYKRGSNVIECLGDIPNSNQILNLQATQYIIQQILNSVSGLTITTNPLQYEYQIWYIPYIDGRYNSFQQNTANFGTGFFSTVNNQNSQYVDSKKFAQNEQKIVSRTGNNDLYVTTHVDSISNIPTTGELFNYNDNNYFANVVNVNFNNNFIEVNAQYTKDFNKIDNRVALNKTFRMERIYADNFVERQVSIHKYIEVTMGEPSNTNYAYTSIIPQLYALLNSKLSAIQEDTPNAIYLRTYNKDGERLTYTPYGSATPTYVPASILYASRTMDISSIKWFARCEDNFATGEAINPLDYQFNKTANKSVRYVDNNGECAIIKVTLVNGKELQYNPLNDLESEKYYPQAQYIGNEEFSSAYLTKQINIDKDNREALAFNFNVDLFSKNKNISIGSGLLKYLYNTTRLTPAILGTISLYGYKYDVKSDTLLTDGTLIDTTIQYSVSDYQLTIRINAFTATDNFIGIALCWDKSKEIILSYDKDIVKNEQVSVTELKFYSLEVI